MAFFRQSEFKWQCDRCGVFFRAGKGGVCPSCNRALCDRHLHGSLVSKLKSAFSSGRVTCVECRTKPA